MARFEWRERPDIGEADGAQSFEQARRLVRRDGIEPPVPVLYELPHLVAHRRQIAHERFNLIEFCPGEFAHLTARRAAGVADFEDALQVVELEPDCEGGADEPHAFDGVSWVFAIAVGRAPRLE